MVKQPVDRRFHPARSMNMNYIATPGTLYCNEINSVSVQYI